MSEPKPRAASLRIDLHSGQWLLTVPADFNFVGPQADTLLDMLPPVPSRRSDVA